VAQTGGPPTVGRREAGGGGQRQDPLVSLIPVKPSCSHVAYVADGVGGVRGNDHRAALHFFIFDISFALPSRICTTFVLTSS